MHPPETAPPAWAAALLAHLEHQASTAPDRLACGDTLIKLDWRAFHAAVTEVREALQAYGGHRLQPDGRGTPIVGIHLRNSVEFAVATFAIATLGAAFELFPTDLDDDTLKALVRASDARVVITEHAPSLAGRDGDVHFVSPAALLEKRMPDSGTDAPAANADADAGADAIFSIVYSSGTTGIPKSIMHSYAAREAVCAALSAMGVGEQARTLVALPMTNNLALVTWWSTLCNGGAIVILDRFDPPSFCRAVESQRVTHFVLSPAQYRELLASPEVGRHDLSSIVMHLSSGSRLWPAEKRRIAQHLPGSFREIYGVTEGGVGTMLDCSELDKLHTVGKPIGMYEMKIIDEAGNPLPPNAIGRIVGRATFMMSRYGDPRRAEPYWRPADDPARRYLIAGDLGYFDDDGYLVVLDRADDTLITPAGRLFPSRIEAALLAATTCVELAVVIHAGDDADSSELVLHWVGPDDQEAALARWLECHVPIASRLVRTACLPRNGAGKVLRHQLRSPSIVA